MIISWWEEIRKTLLKLISGQTASKSINSFTHILFMRKLLFFLVCMVTVWSCNTSEVDPDTGRLGYDYYPLEIGQFSLYEVEQTTYSLTTAPVTIRYQLKELVADTFTDLTKEKAYKIYRFTRPQAQVRWKDTPDSVWTAKRTLNRAIRTENNVPFVKLVFPVAEKQTWNGNALNVWGEEAYQLESVGKPYQVLENSFDHTLTVVQHNDSNFVRNERRVEVYAREVGLIYQERYKVQYCGANSVNCTSPDQIDFGTKYVQRLLTYGKE